MASQTGKQTITIDILPDISRYKENQTMESRQFIEYNMGNIFLKNHEKDLVNIENKGTDHLLLPLESKEVWK